mgnify:CR=1 FL=1
MAKKPRYAHSTLNPLELIMLYKWSAKGGIIPGQDDTVVKYQGNTKTKTRMVPAPWSLVILLAVVNSFAIQAARQAWILSYGKPEIFKYNPDLEASAFGRDAFRDNPRLATEANAATEAEPIDLREQLRQLKDNGS